MIEGGSVRVNLDVGKITRRVERGAMAGLYRHGNRVMTESKKEVPVDTGVLRSTGHVELPTRVGGEILVVVGYGGPAAPYARRQHEDLSFHHPVGKARYLADPNNRLGPFLPETVAAEIGRSLGI